MKKGVFTVKEDVLIRRRVAEWGDKRRGLWVSLEKEMGRPAQNIAAPYELLYLHIWVCFYMLSSPCWSFLYMLRCSNEFESIHSERIDTISSTLSYPDKFFD